MRPTTRLPTVASFLRGSPPFARQLSFIWREARDRFGTAFAEAAGSVAQIVHVPLLENLC